MRGKSGKVTTQAELKLRLSKKKSVNQLMTESAQLRSTDNVRKWIENGSKDLLALPSAEVARKFIRSRFSGSVPEGCTLKGLTDLAIVRIGMMLERVQKTPEFYRDMGNILYGIQRTHFGV